MATVRPASHWSTRWHALLRHSSPCRPQKRRFADMVQSSSSTTTDLPETSSTPTSVSTVLAPRSSLIPPRSEHRIANRHHRPPRHALPPIRVHAPLRPPARLTCPEPLRAVDAANIATLDPTGARTRLFSRHNPDAARAGDVLLVRRRGSGGGEPFAGVCLSVRRRGADTAVLLRGQLTRVGVEMWFKVYSPAGEAIEVVQRYEEWKKSGRRGRPRKRPRRARLYYMRTRKHDRGSVEAVVRRYLRQRAALGRTSSPAGGAAGAAGAGAPAGKPEARQGKK